MATHRIDELNLLTRRMLYREYYSIMEIPFADKRKREKLAEEIDDIWIEILSIYMVAKEYNQTVNLASIKSEYLGRIADVLREAEIPEETIQNYIDDVATGEMDVTQRRYLDDPYWISAERSVEIATNDSNMVFHAKEYMDAAKSGKRYHRWRTMEDNRVRDTHVAVDGTVLPINEPFVVGNSLMNFPMDLSYGADPSEYINCRCWAEYI